jgi:bacteriorhodopsin
MLIIGYLGETKIIHKIYSVGIGFLFFFLSFYYLFHGFAKHTQIGKITISMIAIVWALYGVAHIFSDKWKNVCYNILDLVSKNIFGVIIVFMLIHYKKLIPNKI